MKHYTCDMCGKPTGEQRFVAQIQIHAAFDPDLLDASDLDTDHLQEIAELIAQADPIDGPDLEDLTPQQLEFDLCAVCHQRFRQDPLGPHQQRQPIQFSEN